MDPFLVEGVVLVVLGATAIVIPVLATLATTIFLAGCFGQRRMA